MKFGTVSQICPPTGDRPLKFVFFQKKQHGGGRHIEIPNKSRHHNNELTDLLKIWQEYANLVS